MQSFYLIQFIVSDIVSRSLKLKEMLIDHVYPQIVVIPTF
jgi:hypothetical protein